MTIDQCKRKLFKIGLELGVSPKLISTRLLSQDDKNDMLNDLIPDDALLLHVKVWKENGMPEYANGKTDFYKRVY